MRVALFAVLCAGSIAQATVFPTTPHAASNFIPFSPGTAATPTNNSTMHQVFASSLFSTATGGLPAQITGIGFAPGVNGVYNGSVTISLGYTNAIPGVGSGAGGLAIPTAGGGGTPNANGAVTTYFSNPAYTINITNQGANNFGELVFPGNFVYNPALGNLLVELVVSSTFGNTIDLSVSRSAGSAESSRAYTTTRFAPAESFTTATRMDFTFTAVPSPSSLALLGLGGLVAMRRRR